MNRVAFSALALAALLLAGPASAADQLSVLSHVRSSVRGNDCRVVFTFEGEVRFSSEQTTESVRLVFPQTRPAGTAAIARRELRSGPVHSIAFSRSADGSLVATLQLAPGSSYRSVCPASGTELTVDVYGPGTAGHAGGVAPARNPARSSAAAQKRVAGAQTPAPEQTAAATGSGLALRGGREERQSRAGAGTPGQTAGAKPGSEPPVKISLIDIPAMAMSQMETERGGEPQEGFVARESAQATGISAGMALFLSVCVSLVSTAAGLSALALMRRRSAGRRRSRIPVPEPQPEDVPRAEVDGPSYDRGRSEEETRLLSDLIRSSTESGQEEEAYGHETSLQMARTFRRGSEEIALAQRLHDRGTPALTPGRLDPVLSRATTPTQRVQAARKLGVGRGELDLALKLKTLARAKKEGQE